jgi:hypothetical protein
VAEHRTYDELVESKAGALRRLYTIVCVIILEILQRMAMMDNPALKPLPSTVLARAIAGDSFGLPAPLAATLRLLARELRRWAEPPAPQAQAQAQPEPATPQPHAAPPVLGLPHAISRATSIPLPSSRCAKAPAARSTGARSIGARSTGARSTGPPPLWQPPGFFRPDRSLPSTRALFVPVP